MLSARTHHIGLGDRLQARREVRRFTDNVMLLHFTRPIKSPATTKPVAMPITGLRTEHLKQAR